MFSFSPFQPRFTSRVRYKGFLCVMNSFFPSSSSRYSEPNICAHIKIERCAHAWNIKHGQTNPRKRLREFCAYAHMQEHHHHLHMIPKCHNLNRFIYKIQFVFLGRERERGSDMRGKQRAVCTRSVTRLRMVVVVIARWCHSFFSFFQHSNFLSHRFIHYNDVQFMHELNTRHTYLGAYTVREKEKLNVITVPIKRKYFFVVFI